MKRFRVPWIPVEVRGRVVWRAVADLHINGIPEPFRFLVDSGADISLAPLNLAERAGLDLEKGEPILLRGISPKPECAVEGRVVTTEARFADTGLSLKIPVCYAPEPVPFLLGRTGVLPPIRIILDGEAKMTTFEAKAPR